MVRAMSRVVIDVVVVAKARPCLVAFPFLAAGRSIPLASEVLSSHRYSMTMRHPVFIGLGLEILRVP